jgi:anion-transporting  ArsA/GET3 family ATPase
LGVLGRLTGAGVLREITAFFTAIAGMIDALAERAAAVAALLREESTSFVLVSSPRREAVEEAIAFAGELRHAQLRLSALVVNRVHPLDALAADPAALEALLGPRLAALVAAQCGELVALAEADTAALDRLREAFAALEPMAIPDLGDEIEDLGGLARIGRYLERSTNGTSPSAAQ